MLFFKNRFHENVLLSRSIPIQFLAFNLEVLKSLHVTVVGCYKTASATQDALSSLTHLISELNFKEIVLLGDVNWKWQQAMPSDFKSYCNSLHLFQIIKIVTGQNLNCPENSTLIDLNLTK